jgi:hypothetical protein
MKKDSDKSMACRLCGWLSLFLFFVFLTLVWLPEVSHYYVRNEVIERRLIEQGRTTPSDSVLDEMRSHRLLEHEWQNQAQLVETAEKLLTGEVQFSGLPPAQIHLPFDPSDLEKGSTQWQLQFSGLIVPETLIDAYRATGREQFYDLARDSILAWAKFEKSAWLNRGFLWNDHAVATRVRTLADFWSIYRRRPDFRPDIAQLIWEFAARSGALLAKPDQYTFATNHGVMQNIALWQLSLAFPALPKSEEYKQLALSRLKGEISFYVAPDGAILEHSADYHAFGLYLFGMALRYATLLHLNPPMEWDQKYEKATQFYLEIRRPDGSLPPFGDTAVGLRHKAMQLTRKDEHGLYVPLATAELELPPDPIGLYPVSGYAILWDDVARQAHEDVSQTVLAWSYFTGHGHKHADEPSVLLWSGGQEWWTNSGYWSYDDPGRVSAECWEGSNAPHLTGEKCRPNRKSSLIGSLSSSSLFAAEVERSGPGDLTIARLLVHTQSLVWVIVDHCTGASQNTLQTIWTTAPNVTLEVGATPGAFLLSTDTKDRRFRSYFLGPAAMRTENIRGSRDPFAGWISLEGKPTVTNSIVTSQPAEGAWAVTVWAMDTHSDNRAEANSPPTVEWSNAREWSVRVPLKGGSELISREGDRISIEPATTTAGHSDTVSDTLSPPPTSAAIQIAALTASYESEAARYPHFRDLFVYRLRASRLAIAFLLLQGLFFAMLRYAGSMYLAPLRILALFGWLASCVWVRLLYLNN